MEIIFIFLIIGLILVILSIKSITGNQRPAQYVEAPFQILFCDDNEDPPLNTWYQYRKWKNPSFIKMNTEWTRDWKLFSHPDIPLFGLNKEVSVAGVSFENRDRAFTSLGDKENFSMLLEREPGNKHDRNAIKVMGNAIVNCGKQVKQLGWLPKEIAEKLKDEKDIDVRPYSAYLPDDSGKFGLEIRILVRSENYKKRRGK